LAKKAIGGGGGGVGQTPREPWWHMQCSQKCVKRSVVCGGSPPAAFLPPSPSPLAVCSPSGNHCGRPGLGAPHAHPKSGQEFAAQPHCDGSPLFRLGRCHPLWPRRKRCFPHRASGLAPIRAVTALRALRAECFLVKLIAAGECVCVERGGGGGGCLTVLQRQARVLTRHTSAPNRTPWMPQCVPPYVLPRGRKVSGGWRRWHFGQRISRPVVERYALHVVQNLVTSCPPLRFWGSQRQPHFV
jgi:hypothetical protein